MSRRVLINLIVFNVIFAVMAVWAVNSIVTFDFIERPYTISATFEQASGVKAEAEVAYLGVHYGRVSAVERVPGGVDITMKIDRGKNIPEGSIARIFRKSAIGEPYIDFAPPDDYDERTADGEKFIEKGAKLPIEQTSVPLEFSELLRSASRLISAIDVDSAEVVVHELALALDGRGESLRTLAESIDQLTTSFVQKTAELDRLATNNTRLTRVLAEHRGSLGSSITDLRALADSLRRAEGNTQLLLDRGSQLIGITADLVADQKQNLDCILGDLENVVDLTTTDRQLAGLEKVLDDGPTAFRYVWQTRDQESDGLWVRVNILVASENPPEQYVPPRRLPAIPEVPACVSSLGASPGTPFQPSGGGIPTGTLPATGDSPARAVVLVLLAGALLGWRARRAGSSS